MAAPKPELLFRTSGVRSFLRGGYHEAEETPVVVLNGNIVEGVWWPGMTGFAGVTFATLTNADPTPTAETRPPGTVTRAISKADQARGRTRR